MLSLIFIMFYFNIESFFFLNLLKINKHAMFVFEFKYKYSLLTLDNRLALIYFRYRRLALRRSYYYISGICWLLSKIKNILPD